MSISKSIFLQNPVSLEGKTQNLTNEAVKEMQKFEEYRLEVDQFLKSVDQKTDGIFKLQPLRDKLAAQHGSENIKQFRKSFNHEVRRALNEIFANTMQCMCESDISPKMYYKFFLTLKVEKLTEFDAYEGYLCALQYCKWKRAIEALDRVLGFDQIQREILINQVVVTILEGKIPRIPRRNEPEVPIFKGEEAWLWQKKTVFRATLINKTLSHPKLFNQKIKNYLDLAEDALTMENLDLAKTIYWEISRFQSSDKLSSENRDGIRDLAQHF